MALPTVTEARISLAVVDNRHAPEATREAQQKSRHPGRKDRVAGEGSKAELPRVAPARYVEIQAGQTPPLRLDLTI